MGLYDSIEDDLKKIKEEEQQLEEKEDADDSASDGDGKEEEENESGRSEGEEEGEREGGEEGKQELPEDGTGNGDGKTSEGSEKGDESLTPSAAAFAKARREKRALEAEKAALLQQLEAIKSQKEARAEPKETVNDDAEPNKQTEYEAWLEWKDRQLEKKVAKIESYVQRTTEEEQRRTIYNDAVNELRQIGEEYKKIKPDVEEAAEVVIAGLKRSLSLINPDWSEQRVSSEAGHRILKMAAEASMKGLNPAEELYDMAIEKFGYVQKSQQKQEIKVKTNLKTIESNKKRSASHLTGGGQGGSIPLTVESVADMSLDEFSKLTPSQLRELEQMGY